VICNFFVAASGLKNERVADTCNGEWIMKSVKPRWRSIVAIAALSTAMPAFAATIGDWQVEDASTLCSAGTSQNGASMILMTSKSGANGILIKPADQGAIAVGSGYKLQLSFNGSSDREIAASGMKFGGAKVLIIDMPAVKMAAGEADGFALRVKLGGTVLFDKDMHGARDAFAAYVACSKKFGA
jgi:hypothetical protein